ncbi:hypothetical protein C8A03DRAFT_31938 [Achaetomium macrosporum]|uniref:Uncharacterized protein n=1 Tax=Achaetomium macrosporum TaxID=79813 RepID=A0AAN7CDB0_9PEZI|nr:hypothetical protein C8A03DRAFT_31938 [Achaetomium macrosporum]
MSLIASVTRDGWSYSGDFYTEASGNNRHRRATLPELKAVFDGSDGSKDRPAHWYEAQLIHYGLPPSKTKGTAKMRLFDAVSKGNLTVPAHILQVESELKKEWTKREREAKQAIKKLSVPAATTSAKGSSKRKAGDSQAGVGSGSSVNINLTVSIGPQGNVQIAPAETAAPAAKKAKTTKAPVVSTASNSTSVKKSAPSAKAAPTAGQSTPTAPRAKQTARRGTSSTRIAKSVSSRPPADSPNDKPAVRPIQTARRSHPFNRAGHGRPAITSDRSPRFNTTPSQWDSYDEPPPPYPGPPMHSDDGYGFSGPDGEDVPDDGPLPPLGLLNGRYRLRSTWPSEFVDRGEDSGIIFTLDGDGLWGSFEIGPLSGILRLDHRPWSSSHRPIYFDWRGEDTQGGQHDEKDDGSYIKFLGNGKIRGKIGFYNSMLEFEGYRISGQETRSEISAVSMRRQWEERRL